jgi:hypothetical protein
MTQPAQNGSDSGGDCTAWQRLSIGPYKFAQMPMKISMRPVYAVLVVEWQIGWMLRQV